MLIAGNWKMFKGPAEARAFFDAFESPDGVDVVLCPPFVTLAAAVESGRTVYAQNVHWEPQGAYTGEIAAEMLVELGVQGTLVGHSERRQLFGETDEMVARRARAALAAGLDVIACVGETLEQRESEDTELVLKIQCEAIAYACEGHDYVIAYEPVWAIGTGRTATPELAQEAHEFVKSIADVPVLYGGSVKPENARELLSMPAVDGALVGGASLEPDSFLAICQAAASLS
jgi:triosephosphate isomerase (TIM)